MSRIRVGIVGAGGRGIYSFGWMFSREMKDEVEIVALGEPNRVRAEAGLAYLGIRADIHADARDLCARKDIDVVIVTTPDFLHEEICLLAFQNGKHVLVDKPLAITGRACQRVIEASRRAGTLLYMGFNLRHDPVVRKLKQLADEGAFGEIFSLHAVEHYSGGRTYMSRWNRLKKNTGSLWIHKGSHDFDVINWIMGKARPVRVSCFANVFSLKPSGLPFQPRPGITPGPTCTVCPYARECPDRHTIAANFVGLPADQAAAGTGMYDSKAAEVDGYHKDLCMYLSDKDTHDQGVAIVEYDNGATAMHAEYFATPVDNREYAVEGTRGHADADLAANSIELRPRWSHDKISYQISRVAGGHGGADLGMCQEFIRCIQQGTRPTASGVDGAWSVAIGEAAELARTEGRVVQISEVLDVDSPLLKT